MAVSHQEHILSVLQELEKESFKKFKTFLRDEEFLKMHGYSSIPRGHLEDKDYIDVVDCLISHYARDKALKVTGIVLEKIQQKELAERLRDFRTCNNNNPKNTQNTIQILVKHLNRLPRAKVGAFIVAFCSLEAPRGYNQIRKEELEGKTPMQIVKTIINSYTSRYGRAKVRQTLKDINENQIRVDLEKELRGARRTSDGQVGGTDQKLEDEVEITSRLSVITQPTGGATGCELGERPQPGEDFTPKRGRKPKTESKVAEKSNVETSGGAADLIEDTEEQRAEDVTPKRAENKRKQENKQPKCDPGAGDGQIAADQKREDEEEEIAVITQPTGGATGCELGKSPQQGEETKPKRGRKPKTESEAAEKSNEETSGGASDLIEDTEEQRAEDVTPKRAENKKNVNKNNQNVVNNGKNNRLDQ
ncbi:hypothetical protein GDO81_028938 [Engystomops pustulosus]|uniref:Pyrin domain-containing protein n=1 Tax=Engystomops pustulosus TaxID=76066 RepID=A0AAV6Z024_ENGPU|nr:hypothetical protein GDO81_028938 [Engystomops pustulosus]